MPQKTFAEVSIGDRFVLARPVAGQQAGATGKVTMKARDGLSNRLQVRVKFDEVPGEPFIEFPSSVLDFQP